MTHPLVLAARRQSASMQESSHQSSILYRASTQELPEEDEEMDESENEHSYGQHVSQGDVQTENWTKSA